MDVFDMNGELKQDAIDVLYELGNMGVATAVMPIGNIREMKIRVDMPRVGTVKHDLLDEISYDPEQVVVGVSTKLDDTLDGSILFLLSKEFIINTIYGMTGMEFTSEELLTDEDCRSAITEIVNYMTAGYAKVIGAYLNMPVYISAISIGLDKVGTIVQNIVEHSDESVEQAACVNTRFTIVDDEGHDANESGQVLILPNRNCIQKFMEIMEGV